jgi:amino acid permease
MRFRWRKREPMSYAIGLVVLHFILSVIHGVAHRDLAVALDNFQRTFVAIVIIAAPVVAAYLLWKGQLRAGSMLLALSMLASLAFGVYYHFLAPGPDNVDYPRDYASKHHGLFVQTAIELTVCEVTTAIAALRIWWKASSSGTPEQALRR